MTTARNLNFSDEIAQMNFGGSPELSFGSPGWSQQGISASGGTGMGDPIVTGALIKGGFDLLGGLLGGGGKKKERQHQMAMLEKQIAANQKLQADRWATQDKRMEGTRKALAPEQGFIPTYQSLKESNPMLQKFFGGQMEKLFGEDYQGMGGMFDMMQSPEYTGFEQEQAPLEKMATPAREGVRRRMPGYFRDRYERRGSRRGRMR